MSVDPNLFRLWSLLFCSVPGLATVTFLMATNGVWPLTACPLPPSLSDAGDAIDRLYYGIHWVAVVVLIGTLSAIGFVLWRFDHRRQPERKAKYFSHNGALEFAWTLIPGIILVLLAISQMDAWAENKMVRPTVSVAGQNVAVAPLVLVKAKQFGWEFHYPGPDGRIKTADDLYVEGLLVVPSNQDVVLQLESRDVIHSFFVPELRLKQDVVPGMSQLTWFHANQTDEVDILCAELCGWGHYKMKATLRIVSRSEFDAYINQLQSSYEAPVPATIKSAVPEVNFSGQATIGTGAAGE